MPTINKKYKDRLFSFLFGSETNREWTLSLYNGVNGTNYENPEDIYFTTIENAVYMGMKNDISFILFHDPYPSPPLFLDLALFSSS